MSDGGATEATQDSFLSQIEGAFRRQRSEEFTKQFKATREQIERDPLAALEHMAKKWDIDSRTSSFGNFTSLAFKNFGMDTDGNVKLDRAGDFGLREVDKKIEMEELMAIAVFNTIRKDYPPEQNAALINRATKILEVVFYSRRVVLGAFQALLAVHQTHSENVRLDDDLEELLGSWILRYRHVDLTKTTALQKLLLHLLDCAMEKRYRKQNGNVYEPIMANGYETHAWRRVCTMQEFVYAMTKKEIYWEQWLHSTASGNNVRSAVDMLTNCNDFQMPFLRKDRSVFAFNNGVYLANQDRFYRFGSNDPPLSDTVVAAKYFNLDFDDFRDREWRDIPTPNLQKIMDYQEWPAEVCDWLYVMLGRLLYNVNALDGWQVIPFMLGAASSGKSTITLKVAKLFYDLGDVGVMSNNIERQFGISAFYDKLLFVAPEIKADYRGEQGELQSIVSGESVQVSAKHQKAFTVDDWTTPGIMAGNEVPQFTDNHGSVQRRFMVFAFLKAVRHGDMKLGEKLAQEMAAIMCKCNRAYLEAAAQHGHKNLWTVLPNYFAETRAEMAQAVNSVEAFLASADVQLGQDKFCPYNNFVLKLKEFADLKGYSRKVHQSAYNIPFQERGIRVEVAVKEWRGMRQSTQWLVGVDLADDATYLSELG